MNPIDRRVGDSCCRWLAVFFVLAIALISAGAIGGNAPDSDPVRGASEASAVSDTASGGWAKSEVLIGGLAVMLVAAVGYVEWRRRGVIRQWAAQVKEGENARRRLEERGKAESAEGQRARVAWDQEKRDWERCRAELTEEKEKEALEARKLKPLGLLASGIAHDFNNILTIVIGNVSLAKMTACAPEDRQRWLEQAERAALRAKALTQQLLALSKEGLLLKTRAFVQEIFQDAVRLAAPGQNIRFEHNLAANLWPVEVDAGQVIQALEALIMHADRNMPDGGVMVFEAVNEPLAAENLPGLEPGDYAHLSIRSLGGGSHPERLAQAFNPPSGTPAGEVDYNLVMANGIIKRHGGGITFESLEGKGVVFHIYLPANRTVAAADEASPLSQRGLAGRILVMDDEEGIRQVAKVMLKYLGYETVVARDGLEALESYQAALRRQQPFDLVILDLTVPGGLGGKETVHRLRQIDTRAKVVVSSGYFNDPVMAHFRNYGFDGVIPKPYKMDELATVVAAVVRPGARQPERLLRGEV